MTSVARVPDRLLPWLSVAGVLVLLGILGYTLNGALVLIERRVLRRHRGARASALG